MSIFMALGHALKFSNSPFLNLTVGLTIHVT